MRKNRASSVLKPISTILFKKTTSKVGTILLVGFLAVIFIGPFVIPYSPTLYSSDRFSPPSLTHLLGTDNLGHDVLSQVVYGAYPSLIVSLLSAIGGALIGLFAGVVGGYYTKAEGFVSGAADIIVTFPPLPLLILVGLISPNIGYLIIVALIAVLWAPVGRAVRSQVLSVRKRPFVDAAKASGMSDFKIVMKIMIPETASIAFAYFVLDTAVAIIIVTALEFLGVGNPNVVSWGSMFYWSYEFAFAAGAWWWVLAPGVSITIVALSLALIGFSIEEALNPRLRTS
ncbi:MAG: ABC transporter permease [Nitrososphaerales archaeon]